MRNLQFLTLQISSWLLSLSLEIGAGVKSNSSLSNNGTENLWNSQNITKTGNPAGNSERIFPIFRDSTVRFYFFSPHRKGTEEIFVDSPSSVRTSQFSPDIPTKILIHGFKRNSFSDFPHFVKNAYLAYGYEVNIICVDWKRLAADWYVNSAYNTRFVAEKVGELLVFLKDKRFIQDFRHVHLVGFSLGAQVSGYIGKYIISQRNQKIGRITGLDPAGPGFTGPHSSDRLDENDAEFVDVIHTSVKSGLLKAIGHVDFFPNGGEFQPGCSFENWVDPVLGGCSHLRAVTLFIESIRGTQLYGCLCGNWTQYLADECDCDMPSRLNLLGEHTNPALRGTFYLKTDSAPPYIYVPKNGTLETLEEDEDRKLIRTGLRKQRNIKDLSAYLAY